MTDPRFTVAPMEIEVRAAAALLAAGAWDAAPLEIDTRNCEWLTLFLTYTRGGAAGAVDFQPQFSPRTVDDATLQDWYPLSIYVGGGIVAGADTASREQRERVTYQATGVALETFVYGPIRLARNVARVRVPCCESGNVAAPGTAQITGVLAY